jgi:cysteine desulfurase/selenocysteine lyase
VSGRIDARGARGLFPGLSGRTFLDAACVSLAPRPAIDAVEDFLAMAATCEERDASLHHVAMDRLRGRAVQEGAALLGAAEDEVALIESTTHGLNIAAQVIPFEPGDNVVIADLEFLQVAIPWVKLREKGTIAEVRTVRNVDGALPAGSFAEVVDARTKAVVVSSVQWCNGYRVDLEALGRLCRQCGALLVVDAIQELGALALDVRRAEIDLLVSGGHKWLNSPFGCGLLYVNRETLPALEQASWGYLGLAEPEGGWPRYFATPTITPVRPYEFPRVAKSLEINGTANYPGAVALGASLALVNAIGVDRVEARVLGLARLLYEELDRIGVRLVTRPEDAVRSGITTFEVSDDQGDNEAFLEHLLDERVYVSLRYTSGVGGIRVSTHYFNDEGDLEALLGAVRRLSERRLARRARMGRR